jgi:hypothetical protein
MILTDQQMWILGIAAMLLVQAYKIIKAKYSGVILDKKTVQYVAMAVSLVLALVTILVELGPVDLSDPVQLVSTAAGEIAKVFGLATAMYLVLFKRVAESLGLSEENFLTSKG